MCPSLAAVPAAASSGTRGHGFRTVAPTPSRWSSIRGTGIIYSFTIDRRTASGEPRVLVMVEIDPPAGVRVSGEVPDAVDLDATQIGAPTQMDPHTPQFPATTLSRGRAS